MPYNIIENKAYPEGNADSQLGNTNRHKQTGGAEGVSLSNKSFLKKKTYLKILENRIISGVSDLIHILMLTRKHEPTSGR